MAIDPNSVANEQLRIFVERIERLEEERKAIAGDIGEVYAEAKGNGFDKKALKAVVRIRAMDHDARMEHETLVGLYLVALGMEAAPLFTDDDAPAPAGARALARAHVETIEEFDPETGEISSGPAAPEVRDMLVSATRLPEAGPEAIPGDAGGAEEGASVATEGVQSSAQPIPAEAPAHSSTAARKGVPTGARLGLEARISADPSLHAGAVADRDSQAGTQAPPVETHTREGAPADEAEPAPQVEASSVPGKRLTFSDPPHPGCLKPEMCGGFSNLKLCQRCIDAAAAGQAA